MLGRTLEELVRGVSQSRGGNAVSSVPVLKCALGSHAVQIVMTAFSPAQVSCEQFDKIMDLIKCGKEQGAKVETGGKQIGDKVRARGVRFATAFKC